MAAATSPALAVRLRASGSIPRMANHSAAVIAATSAMVLPTT